MGCQQSTCQIKPGDVYDDEAIGAIHSEPVKDVVKEAGLAVKKTERFDIPIGRKLYRPPTSDSAYSETSVDSGMGSAETSLVFKPIQFSKDEDFSIDTSLAKSNSQVVSMCAKKLNISEYPEGRPDGQPCSIYWHSQVHNDMKTFIRSQDSKVNKFPGMTELARKIALTQAIRSMRELFPEEYNFYPQSWILPSQYNSFKNYSTRNPNKWFIVKPDEGAQGVGIYLINQAEQLHSVKDRLLIQEYLDEPYLLKDRLKFDFRVYAVIKSINPLSIYVAREGMARFCTEKYQKPTAGNFTHLYSHLTNYSLNKGNDAYVHSSNLKDQLSGSKRLLSTVFHQMESNGLRTRKLWHDVKLIIVKTVLAMVPEIMLNYEHYFSDSPGPQCFQIMGFDVIVDKNGIPLLLEVNSAPSLVIEHHLSDETAPVRSIIDEMIKVPLVRDTMLLVLNQLNVNETVNHMDKVNNNCQDDISLPKKKKKAHLSEIFPLRYGANSKHLLILDRAVYLFMQFTSIKLSLTISFLSLRAFIKKCSLTDVIDIPTLEKLYCHVNYYFTGRENDLNTGLPFHGFLQLLFRISWIKFSFCDNQLSALQRLFAYCDSALRNYGVRSTRLRRTEVETDVNENGLVEIYLLPSRMKRSRSRYHHQNSKNKTRSRSMQQRTGFH
ncbi:unnamed protein product [Bursaphelenchus okinawaensis]|uniref:Tubulin polyglutamylase TTLL11 n=1 Tax=Bursaphelenchus okinawaensis TaxID=465554 RepID=A0A811LIC5_9BILA|nr:unnamed protein product [Bursaphelenchus okinawaensis]CAG9126396.1 unnamed protein product [Bursaphelenchus okinawaensis]